MSQRWCETRRGCFAKGTGKGLSQTAAGLQKQFAFLRSDPGLVSCSSRSGNRRLLLICCSLKASEHLIAVTNYFSTSSRIPHYCFLFPCSPKQNDPLKAQQQLQGKKEPFSMGRLLLAYLLPHVKVFPDKSDKQRVGTSGCTE